MTNVASLIQSLGGNAAFARIVGVTTEHAGSMKRRGSIPVRYWPKVVEGSKSSGEVITYERLVELHAPATSSSMRGE